MSWSYRGGTYTQADCPDCGARQPVTNDRGRPGRAAAQRWARRHADENPGHRVHVVTESTRVYQSEPGDPE